MEYHVKRCPQESIGTEGRISTSNRGQEVNMTRGLVAGERVTARKPMAHTRSSRNKHMKVVSQQKALEDDIKLSFSGVCR